MAPVAGFLSMMVKVDEVNGMLITKHIINQNIRALHAHSSQPLGRYRHKAVRALQAHSRMMIVDIDDSEHLNSNIKIQIQI